jgi:hypothetical protein
MRYMTKKEIDELQSTKLDRSTPFVISGVSQSQLSIARFYGGCKFQGRNYYYIPPTDELVRDDVARWLAKHRKSHPTSGIDGTQLDLLTDNEATDDSKQEKAPTE